MRAQKRGFFNFIFAFVPGAAEMYMGFMKMGISLMGAFFGLMGLIAFLGLSDAFMMIPIVLWFYSFFHARNMATCRIDVFAGLQDDYFWNEFFDGKGINLKSETAKKISAWVLIIAGVSIIWNIVVEPILSGVEALADMTGLNFIYDAVAGCVYSLPRLIIAVVIIVLGLRLIRGKKNTLYVDMKSTIDTAFSTVDNQEKSEKNA
ncbi:hypothetical protein SAMN04487770_12736 [Butyrivibrio sp. ob235]|uniref:hypothetical protein n=1 Tax=Butyrivibrio sp. ob235 TaxID=1761780 RepID=UPI0008AE0995|nr:hypothetical protein [Butyrivibrio sp. ob235]SEM15607.1 hypothetical protein SAMN04487770_12736 [Butyrivibrio sp. ob235]